MPPRERAVHLPFTMWRSLTRLMLAAVMGGMAGDIGAQQPLRIVVNIPAFRLDVYSTGAIIRSVPVAVGMPRYKTPRGEFAITRIEWNPWWIPPDRPWAAKEHRTRPGPDNPMGRVKLYFRPLYFIHGTPFVASLGRAASHGCVRMSNESALELARLVSLAAASEGDRDELGNVLTSSETRVMTLETPVPTEVRYELAEVRRDSVFVYRDIYALRTRSMRDVVYDALAAVGIDTSAVDDARVAALTRRIPAAGRGVSLDAIVKAGVVTDSARGARSNPGASRAAQRAPSASAIGAATPPNVCW